MYEIDDELLKKKQLEIVERNLEKITLLVLEEKIKENLSIIIKEFFLTDLEKEKIKVSIDDQVDLIKTKYSKYFQDIVFREIRDFIKTDSGRIAKNVSLQLRSHIKENVVLSFNEIKPIKIKFD